MQRYASRSLSHWETSAFQNDRISDARRYRRRCEDQSRGANDRIGRPGSRIDTHHHCRLFRRTNSNQLRFCAVHRAGPCGHPRAGARPHIHPHAGTRRGTKRTVIPWYDMRGGGARPRRRRLSCGPLSDADRPGLLSEDRGVRDRHRAAAVDHRSAAPQRGAELHDHRCGIPALFAVRRSDPGQAAGPHTRISTTSSRSSRPIRSPCSASR